MRLAIVNKSDAATITASSTAGGLVAANLKTPYKTQVWRSTGVTATLTVQWGSPQIIGVVSLPYCSLSTAATVRVRGYVYSADATPDFDTGVNIAVPGPGLGVMDWGNSALGVNGYSEGNYNTCVLWVPVGSYEKLVIDIDDTYNPLGYIEAGRLFCSNYHEFRYNAEYGSNISSTDTDRQFRNEAGDLLTDRGISYKTMTVNLGMLNEVDKQTVFRAMKTAKKLKPKLLSAGE